MATMDDQTIREREEPPFVHGLIVGSVQSAGAALRTLLRSIDQRLLHWAWGLGTIGTFVLIATASMVQTPSIVGVLQGIFVGLFTALLFAVAFGSLLLWARDKRSATASEPSSRAVELDARLAPALAELNTLRADVIQQVKARSVLRVPLGTLAGIVVWVLTQWSRKPLEAPALLLLTIIGAVAGEYWAAYKLERQYRRRYKERVLPQLLADFGDLRYQPASTDEVKRLGALRIVPDFDSVRADDEVSGTYDGLPVRIIEACLRRRQQKKSVVVFDGLFVAITLPRSLSGTTVVLTDRGGWENFKARWRGGSLEVVRLDDMEFEQRYEVYSTDQIEARALLTPAFMERFLGFATRSGFSLPGAIAEGSTLVVALPKRMGTGDLFEPPAYWQPAGGAALVRLENDIRAVLAMADSVITLDFWAAGRQRDAARARAPRRP
jgi:hypothetical protein